MQSLRADAARRRQQERESQRGTPMPSPTPSEADVQSLRSAASSRRSNISRASQYVSSTAAKSEQLESALSEYLRPADLEDEERRENEDPNMYYESKSNKSGGEEKIEKNMPDASSLKSSHKEKSFSENSKNIRCEIPGNLRIYLGDFDLFRTNC